MLYFEDKVVVLVGVILDAVVNEVSAVTVRVLGSDQKWWFERVSNGRAINCSTGLSKYVIALVAPWRLTRNDIGTNR